MKMDYLDYRDDVLFLKELKNGLYEIINSKGEYKTLKVFNIVPQRFCNLLNIACRRNLDFTWNSIYKLDNYVFDIVGRFYDGDIEFILFE